MKIPKIIGALGRVKESLVARAAEYTPDDRPRLIKKLVLLVLGLCAAVALGLFVAQMLQPVILQVKEYLENDTEFESVGVLGIDGSPSCGVKYTCRAPWGGEFSGRDVTDVLHSCHLEEGSGVLMETLKKMLEEEGISLQMEGLFAPEADRAMAMVQK